MCTSNFATIDTETTSMEVLDKVDGSKMFVYDLGYVVYDEHFNVLKTANFVIEEVFTAPMMENAYFKDKIPLYKKWLESKECNMMSIHDIVKIIKNEDVRQWYAYNAGFDAAALINTFKYFNEYCPMVFADIMASTSKLVASDDYIQFAKNKGMTYMRGDKEIIRKPAELVYQFLFDDGFIEDHTALSDAIIEGDILRELKGGFMSKFDQAMDSMPNVNRVKYTFKAYEEKLQDWMINNNDLKDNEEFIHVKNKIEASLNDINDAITELSK